MVDRTFCKKYTLHITMTTIPVIISTHPLNTCSAVYGLHANCFIVVLF